MFSLKTDPKTCFIEMFGEVYVIRLQCHHYENGRLAITAIDIFDNAPFGVLTINMPDEKLEENEICVKTWSENEYWVPQVLEFRQDLFEETSRFIPSGFVIANVWKVNCEVSNLQNGEFI